MKRKKRVKRKNKWHKYCSLEVTEFVESSEAEMQREVKLRGDGRPRTGGQRKTLRPDQVM